MKPYIIPVFIPHSGCVNQCVFCNQFKLTGVSTPVTPADVAEIIEKWLPADPNRLVEVAFYGGSFTALPYVKQQELLEAAGVFLSSGRAQSIRISTRPDCIDPNGLKLLDRYGVRKIELGVQSMDDEVLRQSLRGHDGGHVVRAAKLIRAHSFQLGLQFMPGLPGDTISKMMGTVEAFIALQPDFVRIYPTVVLKHTALERMYREGKYLPLKLAEAIRYCTVFKLLFQRAGIRVIRTGLQATTELGTDAFIAGPYHPSFGELVDMQIFYLMLERIFMLQLAGDVFLYHHLKDASKVRGMKCSHLEVWRKRYPKMRLHLSAGGVEQGTVMVQAGGQRYFMSEALVGHI